MKTSDSITKIAAALCKALPEIQNATKNAANPHFRSKYADLGEIIAVSKPVLATHGIAVLQAPGFHEGVVTITTRLLHESGEWIESEAGSPVPKMDPQGVGSAVTYLRRYSLAGLCGITQEDDDGNAASQTRNQETGEPHPKASDDRPASKKQLELLEKLSSSSVLDEEERERLRSKIMNEEFTAAKASQAIEAILERQKEAK